MIVQRGDLYNGLSPPTRGSRDLGAGGVVVDRSIPAHTGKPLTRRTASTSIRVYPRPHGEALQEVRQEVEAEGLSPPTRGSRASRRRRAAASGSIPAHTGKPDRRAPLYGSGRVYPRPHGEAPCRRARSTRRNGLSPPTRGSQGRAHRYAARVGSIPAHTGKPRPRGVAPRPARVYPRPHGEATVSAQMPPTHPGLSPPTRGSPRMDLAARVHPGSIPAHTGKPSIRCRGPR